MNSKLLMTLSAIIMGALSIVATFLPNELLQSLGQTSTTALVLILQITGALYFGFAIMNWMAKTVLIGGIYARPLAMGNFSHFLLVAIALVKLVLTHPVPAYLWILAIMYLLFATLFGIVLFKNPFKKQMG